MLNYETLLSSYDDKLTLMQWLKKVEEALKDASATSFDVIKTGDATLKFAITFEDGTSLVSGEIVLQQGESVASGEIRNGHLFLTLTNGQELDCGLLFNGEIPSLEVRSLEVTGGLIVGADANASIGGDLSVQGLTEVQNLLAYGHVETETLTAAGDEISAEKPVVEVMTGYSYTSDTSTGWEKNILYAGAVKNGNKLTLAIAAEFTKIDASASAYPTLGRIYVPYNIFAKLIPFTTSGLLDYKNILAVGTTEYKNVGVYVEKTSSFLRFSINEQNLLTLNEKYYIRNEVTFLLSENLAA